MIDRFGENVIWSHYVYPILEVLDVGKNIFQTELNRDKIRQDLIRVSIVGSRRETRYPLLEKNKKAFMIHLILKQLSCNSIFCLPFATANTPRFNVYKSRNHFQYNLIKN